MGFFYHPASGRGLVISVLPQLIENVWRADNPNGNGIDGNNWQG
jgi:hypothetical protein